ncbi:hypothetical protein M405DRAFT_466523 [Rhizopogon salebrosus TDB-379]|nr:hypothetical protein M405DRAFT_466523 [Rhizopogon salebrosus TDB-379]
MPRNLVSVGMDFLITKCEPELPLRTAVLTGWHFKYISTRTLRSSMRHTTCSLKVLKPSIFQNSASTAQRYTAPVSRTTRRKAGRKGLDIPMIMMISYTPTALFMLQSSPLW